MTGDKTTVVVAMSGGVDSSVAAALLVERGYNVIGMMMRLWSEETAPGLTGHNRCCTPEQMNDARRVADMLDIPFYVLDTRDVFRNKIVQFFIDQHADGLTPNPCLACNMHIRFDWLLNNALALGADYLATGHYARITQSADGLYELRKGYSLEKDQSYVLSVMTQEQLRHTLFPVGEYIKPQVRELAANFGLPVASKHDSQDLCFLGDGDYRRFLREHGPMDLFIPGPILNRRGEQVGTHDGLPNYTIGQRKGLGISGSGDPLYVLDLDRQRNAVIVGTRDELGRDRLIAGRVNWIAGASPAETIRAEVKIRYKAKPAPATLEALPDGRVNVIFDDPLRDITPGQGAVFYDGDRCLGGGLVQRLEHLEPVIISS